MSAQTYVTLLLYQYCLVFDEAPTFKITQLHSSTITLLYGVSCFNATIPLPYFRKYGIDFFLVF